MVPWWFLHLNGYKTDTETLDHPEKTTWNEWFYQPRSTHSWR
jgi:hypothetical protein